MTRKEIVGENIRNLRNARGMSQTDFAQAIKRRQSTVAMYENGDRLPPAPIITNIAAIFGVSFDDVYYSEEERRNGEHARSTVTFDTSKANIPVQPYHGLADSLAEAAMREEDDELWQMREDMRRNPQLREIYSMSSKATPDKMKQIRDFVRFVTNGDDDDDTNTP